MSLRPYPSIPTRPTPLDALRCARTSASIMREGLDNDTSFVAADLMREVVQWA